MASHPFTSNNEIPPLLLADTGKPSFSSVSPLWIQLDPDSQQQIAQHLARLIQAFRLQRDGTEEEDHE